MHGHGVHKSQAKGKGGNGNRKRARQEGNSREERRDRAMDVLALVTDIRRTGGWRAEKGRAGVLHFL